MGLSLGSVGKASSGGLGLSSIGGSKNIGGLLNDITGVTASSDQAFAQSKYLAGLSFKQQKWMASHAHQLEMQDLADAGLNPALTTQSASAGAIASDGGISNSGHTGTSAGITPLSILDAINTTRQTNAQNANLEAGATLQKAEAINIIEMLPLNKGEKEALIKKLGADTKYQNERARGFSETSSSSSSYDKGSSTSAGAKGFGFGGNLGKSQNNAGSTSKTHSRTW